MLPIVDSSIVALISTLILAGLEGSGYLSPAHHTENLASIEIVVGGILGAIGISAYFIHKTAVENQKLAVGLGNTNINNSFMQTLINGLKDFVFSKQPSVSEVTTSKSIDVPVAP